MFESLREDVRFVHELKFPGTPRSAWSTACFLLGSRGMLLLTGYRAGRVIEAWNPQGPFGRILRTIARVALLVFDYLTTVVAKGEIRRSCVFEPGIYLSERGHLFLGPSVLGAGTIVHDHVTIGRAFVDKRRPEIGRGVWIGPHSVIVGGLKVGDGATILPHTVLTWSIPPGTVVQGNPASVVSRGFDNSALRRTLATDVAHLVVKAQGVQDPRHLESPPVRS